MNIRKLSPHESPNYSNWMCELLRSDKDNPKVDFYLDRGNNFWSPYSWYENSDYNPWGVFIGDELIGMTALVRLPYFFSSLKRKVYLHTDFFVRHDYRKSFAAAKLVRALHENYPVKEGYGIGVENQPGFLEPLIKFATKFGSVAEWLPNTTLRQYFISKYYAQKGDSTTKLEVCNDKLQIAKYWQKYLKESQDHGMILFRPDFDICKISNINYFSYGVDKNNFIEGLLIDKSELQRVIWNGQSRLAIEKYRRLLKQEFNKDFNSGDELKFLNLCFPIMKIADLHHWSIFLKLINNYAFENKYFSWTHRDIHYSNTHTQNMVFLDFTRRIQLARTFRVEEPDQKVKEILKDKRLIIESVFL